MIINAKSKVWENRTAYLPSGPKADGKKAETENSSVQNGGPEHIKNKPALLKNNETGREGTAKTEAAESEAPGCSKEADMDVFLSSLKQEENPAAGLAGLSSSAASKSSGSDKFQMRSSSSEDSVGQLASMLARAETKLDVQQVAGKAMRALANLRAAAACGEGKEAKKMAQQIRRLEKLMKRIEKKLKHLSKEEQLELQKKRAEEKNNLQKVKSLEDELKTRRKKRRRDEKNYAEKEMAEDQKEAASEMTAALSGGSAIPSAEASLPIDAATSMEAAAMDGVSLDITV